MKHLVILFTASIIFLLLIGCAEPAPIAVPEGATQVISNVTPVETPTDEVAQIQTPSPTATAELDPTATATATVGALQTEEPTQTEEPSATPLTMLAASTEFWTTNVYTFTFEAGNLQLAEHPIRTGTLQVDQHTNTPCVGLKCERQIRNCDICIAPEDVKTLAVGEAMVLQRIISVEGNSELYVRLGSDDGSSTTLKNTVTGEVRNVIAHLEPHSLSFTYYEGLDVAPGTYVLEVLWYNSDGIAELYLDYEIELATAEVLITATAAVATITNERSLTLVYQPPNDNSWYPLGGGNWIPKGSTVKVASLVGFTYTKLPGGGYCFFNKPTGGTEGPSILHVSDEVSLNEPGTWQVSCKITSDQQYSDGGYIDVPFTYMEFGIAN